MGMRGLGLKSKSLLTKGSARPCERMRPSGTTPEDGLVTQVVVMTLISRSNRRLP